MIKRDDRLFRDPEWEKAKMDDKRNEQIKGKANGGQPTKYKPEYTDRVKKMYLLNSNATDKDIARQFDVSESTVNNWKLAHPEFLESIRFGREEADNMVANSLFSMTQKRTKKVTKVFCNKGEIVSKDIEEELEPDIKACHLWLMNRRRKEWGGNNILDEDGAMNIIVAPPSMTAGWLSKPKADAEDDADNIIDARD